MDATSFKNYNIKWPIRHEYGTLNEVANKRGWILGAYIAYFLVVGFVFYHIILPPSLM